MAFKGSFQNTLHIQTNNWTMYALCESTLSSGLQAEVMAFKSFSKHYTHSKKQSNKVCALWKYTEWWASSRSNGFQRKFSKHFTHSNKQLNKVCALWKYSEWWASSRSSGFQEMLFKTIYTFKQTIEQSMRSAKVLWAVGCKQKYWPSEEVFQNIIHIQTKNWTKYGLWKYSEWWASSRSNGFQEIFFKTLYTFKHTLEQSKRSVIVQWLVGFKQKQCLSEEVFENILYIQTYNWTN